MERCICLLRSKGPTRIPAKVFSYMVLGGLLLLANGARGGPTISRTGIPRTHVSKLPLPSESESDGSGATKGRFRRSLDSGHPTGLETEYTWRNGTVCRPKSAKYPKLLNTAFKFGNAVDGLKALENCSVIEGNLEINWMYRHVSAKNYTDLQFPKLVEITGYLLLYRVYGLTTLGQLFPNLRVIRAKHVYFGYAMVLYENENLASISLPNLGYIGGDIVAMQNPQLCYVDDYVDWIAISKKGNKPVSSANRIKESGCELIDGCPSKCKKENCWDMDTCQRVCQKCVKNFGTSYAHFPGCDVDGNCCHEQCLGGCTVSGSALGCYACKHVYHDGECREKCPSHNADKEELLEFDERRCVTKAQCVKENTLNKFHKGTCIKSCPKFWVDHKDLAENSDPADHSVRVCQECRGICAKACDGGSIQTAAGSKRFLGCTSIDGILEIALSNNPGNLSLLEDNLALISEVRDYVKIVRSPFLESLSFLKSLKHIRGERLDVKKYAFYVMENENMESIWDFDTHPQLIIDKGMMFFQQNRQLCHPKIRTLLDTTIFNGYTDTELENGTKIKTKISNATHGKFDVSPSTNGKYGNCFNNSLFFELTDDFGLTYFNFSKFQANDDRMIISYVLYYRMMRPNENATYHTSRCGWRDKEKNEPQWATLEIEKSEKTEIKNGMEYYTGTIYSIENYSRYAAYVQTFTTKAIGMDGAKSSIIYYTTKPTQPDKPRNIVVTALDVEGDNVALTVRWEHPQKPNGIIETYSIYYRMLPWRTDLIYRKEFCHIEIGGEKARVVPTAQPVASNGTNSKEKCDCKDGTSKNNLHKANSAKVAAYKKKMAEIQFNLENYIQNNQFQKNFQFIPNKLVKSSVKKVQKSVASATQEQDVNITTMATATETEGTTTGVLVTNTTTGVLVTNTTPGPTTLSPTGNKDPSAPSVASMASVKANQTFAPIFNLEPNMEYSIEVVACHAYDKEVNVTRCSKRAMVTAFTKPDPRLDIIDSKTVHIDNIVMSDGSPALNFSWVPPAKTNGPVLTYTIRYSKVTDKAAAGDANSDRGVTNATKGVRDFCIGAKAFMDKNNSYVWGIRSLSAGNYMFSVRMKAVGTKQKIYTDPYQVVVDGPNNPPSSAIWSTIAPTCTAIVVIGAIIVVVVCYRRKKKKPIPSTLHSNSYNNDYAEYVYTPDEWEVERSKVKIGISLGQGSFGMVYEGDAKDLPNIEDKKSRKVAIKTVNDSATIQDRINFLNEASRMKSFSCHHIVQLLGVVSQGQPVLVIMELMGEGDLKNYLRMHRPDEPDNDGRRPPTLREILQMAAEVADGMAYLSDRKFVHRDLAARNCMVAHDLTVKIGDFGMTRDIYDADYYRKGGKGMLPVRWMAPESLRDGVYTSKSDVWSYGVVLWEMATLAAQPYQGFSNEEVLKFVMDNRVMEMPDGCPTRLYDMMMQCWQFYPRYRPSFATLLESLQGDVKKTFFSVSWYYSQRDDEASDVESDSLEDDDGQNSESHPLHPSSIHSSDQHLEADHDLEDDNDEIDDMESLHSTLGKDLVIDMPPPVPRRLSPRPIPNDEEFEMSSSPLLLNGDHVSSDSDETDDSYFISPLPRNGLAESSSPSKAASSIVSAGQPPPSYNSATLDQPIVPKDPTLWSSEGGSKGNSCNGSANGHIHYGTNTLTSAC